MLDFFILCAFFVIVGMRIYYVSHFSALAFAGVGYDNSRYYTELELQSYLYRQEMDITAINIFLCFFKMFAYLELFPLLYLPWKTLSNASDAITSYIVLFFFVFIGFALVGMVIFGRDLNAFRNFGLAMITVFEIMLGFFDYDPLPEVNRFMAPLYFSMVIIIINFVLVNMFLAIIIESWGDIKANPDLMVGFTNRIADWFRRRCRDLQQSIRHFSRGLPEAGVALDRSYLVELLTQVLLDRTSEGDTTPDKFCLSRAELLQLCANSSRAFYLPKRKLQRLVDVFLDTQDQLEDYKQTLRPDESKKKELTLDPKIAEKKQLLTTIRSVEQLQEERLRRIDITLQSILKEFDSLVIK
eukprot:gnl/Spiro4/14279_TR7678_c0_g1_i1.p1 gnl/Spiro4/14279_TR7678_c0_g1~~gnl/Spiro4/14279_TR7678_c0_g1_i1.p1  ORF type:complete len:356 (+),score=138.51 gnl/Spiro4/14279_TR7678_c0_g1_i1:709-1776(+)